jgi:hypothetical protein
MLLALLLVLANPKVTDVPKPGACHYVVLKNGTLAPDPGCTPGEIEVNDVHVLCTEKQTRRWKPDPAVLHALARAHDVPRCGEADHLIPLCLGGANSIKNLWCQPAPQYRDKDKLEAKLCREVCAGTIALGEARITILDPHNWE